MEVIFKNFENPGSKFSVIIKLELLHGHSFSKLLSLQNVTIENVQLYMVTRGLWLEI